MNIGSRFVLLVGLVLASLVSVLVFVPGWLAETTRSLSRESTAYVSYSEEVQRYHELEWQREVLLNHLQAKDEVIRDFLAGRMTFLEAASWFRHINSQPPGYQTVYAPSSGATVEECNCRQVILWAQNKQGRDTTSGGNDLVEQLEQELQQELRQPNGLQLPPCPERPPFTGPRSL